jgi:uncharacterized beta-barrel protein YwiB (DUF1934 family)
MRACSSWRGSSGHTRGQSLYFVVFMKGGTMVPVKITIRSENKENHEGPSTFVAFGHLTEKGKTTYVRYKESEVTGMDGTNTTLKWTDDSLVIIRHGAFEHRQCYERGRNTLFQYRTPYFNLPMCAFTHLLTTWKGEGRWEVNLDYDMEIDHRPNGRVRLKILIEEETISGH